MTMWFPKKWMKRRRSIFSTVTRPRRVTALRLEALEARLTLDGLSAFPWVVSILQSQPPGPVTDATSVSYTVTFSESVMGVDAADFEVVRTGSVAIDRTEVASISDLVYSVTISGIRGSGTLGLNLVDNDSIRDLAGNPLVSSGGLLSLQAQQTYATGLQPASVKLGDLNRDGVLDLAVANWGSNSISVLRGNGNGTFQTQQTLATGTNPREVGLGDLNGDGRLDLAFTNMNANTVGVLLSNVDGTFQAQQIYATGARPKSIAVSDVSSDGKADLIVTNYGNDNGTTVSVLLNNGNGTFQAQQTFATGTGPATVAVGDVNGDGRADLAVANHMSGTVGVLLGNGNGTFQNQQTFAAGQNPESVVLGDVNEDGRLDIIVTNYWAASVSVLLGNGNGTFQPQQVVATGPQPALVALGDLNGDGRLDLAVGNLGSNNLGVLLGNGNGTFQAQRTFATGTSPIAVALGDVNGDGRSDLAIANNGSNTVDVLLNSGRGSFTGPAYTIKQVNPQVQSIDRTTPSSPTTDATSVSYTVTFSESVMGVDAADFEVVRTGSVAIDRTEVASISDLVYSVTISGIRGSGTLGLNLVDNDSIRDLAGNPLVSAGGLLSLQAQQTYATGVQPASVKLGDLNRDGVLDLAVANWGSNSISVLRGNGNGTFQTQQTLATGTNPREVGLGDLNGDGRLDLAVTNMNANTVGVLLCNVDGTFQAQQTYATGARPKSIAVSDVSSDGKADLIVTNYGNDNGTTVSVLLNNGNGTFQAQQTFATGTGPATVAVGDVNGDGRADLAVANHMSRTVGVLLGNGNGTFQSQQTFAAGQNPESVVLGDVNEDGRLDIIVTNYWAASVSVLLGNGNGTFQPQQVVATGPQPALVALGDLNGDGRLDLAVGNLGSNNLGVLLGNGNGTFQAQRTFATGTSPIAVALGDVNGDGRSDLAIANNGSNTVGVLLNSGRGSFTGPAYTIKQVNPQVQSIDRTTPSSPTTDATSVSYTVTFSESVMGVDAADFEVVRTGSVAIDRTEVASISDLVYSVTISGIRGSGTLGLNLVDNDSIRDLAGNPLVSAGGLLSLQAQQTYATGVQPASVKLGDLNRDGVLDLAVANWGSNSISVLRGNGNGTFQTQQTLATGTNPREVGLGDLNGDGRLDLAVTNMNANTVGVLLCNVDGTFQAQQTYATGARRSRSR